MAIDQEGNFYFEDRDLYEGIRQDLPQQARRFRVVKNVHLFKRGSLSYRNGHRGLNQTVITAAPDIRAGIDAHFADGTQKVVVVAGTDAYTFTPATRVFAAASQSLAAAQPDLQMFADLMILLNGTDAKSFDGSSWANLTGSPPAGTMSTVHANRLIVSGVSATPYEFYFGGVRDPNSWDTTNDKVIVGGTSGEIIKGISTLGSFLLVCTLDGSWAYQQSATNPADWDFITISEKSGAINNDCLYPITRAGLHMTFGWDQNGPVVFYRIGETVSVKDLWLPVKDMVAGIADSPLEGLDTTRYGSVVTSFQESIQEVRYAATKSGDSENNVLLCYDLQSVIDFIHGRIDAPKVTVKDNTNTDWYPCDALFEVEVDSDGLPSTTGRKRLFGGRDGFIYELDPPGVYTDDGNEIPHSWVRAGYSGTEEGAGDYRKVATKAKVRGTHEGGYAITIQVSADGDISVDDDQVSLDPGVGQWGDGGLWTPDPSIGKWNGTGIKLGVGYLASYGETFEVYGADTGAIDGDFEMSEITLEGHIYERV